MRWSACALACLLSLVIPAQVHAEHWTAPAGGMTLELPDGDDWKPMEMPAAAVASLPPNATLIVRRAEVGSRAAIVTTVPNVPSDGLSDEIITGFERGLYAGDTSKKVSGEKVTVHGVPAYRYLGRLPNGAWNGGYVLMNGSTMYNIQAVKADGDPFQDKDLNAYLDSYRLP